MSGPLKYFGVEGVALEDFLKLREWRSTLIFDNFGAVPPKMHGNDFKLHGKSGPLECKQKCIFRLFSNAPQKQY